MYQILNLDISNTTIINGLSTDTNIKKYICEEKNFDIVYIDGSHNYDDVINDIELSNEILKNGEFLVMDDASFYLKMGKHIPFKGYEDVANAIKEKIDNNKNYKHLFACGHNRVWVKNQ